jgi:hypothetical protein
MVILAPAFLGLPMVRQRGTGGPKTALQVDPRRLFVGEEVEKLEGADCGAGHLFPLQVALRFRFADFPPAAVRRSGLPIVALIIRPHFGDGVFYPTRASGADALVSDPADNVAIAGGVGDFYDLSLIPGSYVESSCVVHVYIVADYTNVVKYKIESA